jgi:thioredoxin reductase (NADPH)
MTEASVPEKPFDRDPAFPRLGSEFLGVLDVAGRRRPLERGTALYRAGEINAEFFVIVRGTVALVDRLGSAGERVFGVLDEHCFAGELNLMTGQPA